MAKGKTQQQKSKDEQLDAVDPVADTGVTGEQEEGTILNDALSDDEEKSAKEASKAGKFKDEELKDEKKELELEIKDEPKGAEAAEFAEDKTKEDLPAYTTTEEAPKTEEPRREAAAEAPTPPPKPARPLSPRQESKKNLKDAFPTVEDSIIEAILIASSFKLEPAFNALLYLSDPESINFNEVPVVDQAPTPRRQLTQVEQDEMLAKRLDEEFNKNQRRRHRQHHKQSDHHPQSDHNQQQRSRRDGSNVEENDDDVLTNFVEKDLPQIKEQFSKNIEETKTKFNSWVSGWKKQYQTTSEEWQQKNKSSFGQQQQPMSQQRRKYEFEEDPEEVDVRDFHGISLGKDEGEDSERPKLPNRNRAQSTDLYGTPKNSNTAGSKKWEPLQSQKPDPIKLNSNVDDDDFLLSDDEDLGKK